MQTEYLCFIFRTRFAKSISLLIILEFMDISQILLKLLSLLVLAENSKIFNIAYE